MMKYTALTLSALLLAGCAQPNHPAQSHQHFRITGAPEIATKLKEALAQPLSDDKKPLYNIHIEERASLEKLNPLNIKTLHTAYQLNEQVTLTWDPVPKGRSETASFKQSLMLDIASTTSIKTSPQVRHGKERLRKHLVNEIVAYLR